MKIAYLGKIQLSDVDLSYLHEAQKKADITFILEVNPRFMKGPAFSFQHLYPHSGVFRATEAYPEFESLRGLVDLNKCFVVNTCGPFWQLKAFWTNLLLVLFLLRNRFDVLHLVWPLNIYEFVLYVLRRKMMLTLHDPFPHTGNDTFIVRLRRKFAFWFIPKLIILNETQRQDFLRTYHLSADRVVDSRLGSYVYLQNVKPDFSQVSGLENGYVLFFGKISPYKGVDYLLKAMKKVHECCPDCRLVVAGGGRYPFDVSPYQSLDFVDIRNRFIPNEELVALIQCAAFVVCPYTDATQSGVIMSAFAFNKPVIATNVGGLPEMVRHGEEGLIVKAKDIDALADAIALMWTDHSLLDTYSRNIEVNYSEGNLSWRKIAEELNVQYQNVSGGHKS